MRRFVFTSAMLKIYIDVGCRVDEKDTQLKSDNEVEQAPCSNTIDVWINFIRGVGQTFKGAVKRAVIGEFMLRNIKENLFAIRKCKLQHRCCENNLCSRGHPRADAYWIANVVKEKLRGEPSYRPCTMQMNLQRDFGGRVRIPQIAVSKDTNDDLFTIAYVIVDAENNSNWDWFCYHLSRVLLYYQCISFDEFTFFSDRHASIIKAVNQVFFGSLHAYCLRHLVDNFMKKVLRSYPRHNKKHWSSVFKKVVYAPYFQEYEQHINNIFESMPLARGFIVNSNPQSWIMKMMHRQRESTLLITRELSPRKEKSVASVYIESRILRVQRSCDWKFEVVDGEKSFAVDLVDMTCSCRAWQINKLPCKHACSAIETKALPVYDFCDKYFKIEAYRAAYKGHINPIPTFDISESCVAESDVIQAPSEKAITGRGFEHEIAIEKAYTLKWKHCWIALGLRLLVEPSAVSF
ncbi:uncharacterized protein [Henckelia pumila]|uniref:uncharacterized protein n=1 Tax=Henckelia pumila TaxID=405737 RepID=UPI003C6DD35D